MESNYELNKMILEIAQVIISITTKIEGFDFDNILIDVSSHKNALIYNILFKTLIGAKPYGVTRVCNGTRYLTLLELGKFCIIFDRIRYLIGVKIAIKYVFS